jgi:hypothetical protein
MTLLKRGRIWHYDFWFRGRRYKATTHQTERQAALIVESELKKQLRLRLAGLATATAPSFTAWAGRYYAWARAHPERVRRPETIDHQLRVLLRFWGRRPEDPAKVVDGEPYHNLRLSDPIDDPSWVLRFEAWMEKRGIAGGTRNHYRSRLSQLYVHALRPAHRLETGLTSNPFQRIDRDATCARTVTLTVPQLQALLSHASYHVRLAVAVVALAPRLRLASILALQWRDLDRDLTWITVQEH